MMRAKMSDREARERVAYGTRSAYTEHEARNLKREQQHFALAEARAIVEMAEPSLFLRQRLSPAKWSLRGSAYDVAREALAEALARFIES